MTRVVLLFTLLACASLALGQGASSGSNSYQPAVPPPSMGGYGGGGGYGYGYGGGGVGSTAAGSAMAGMANVISAQGDYNLATSAAAVNLTQAQRNEIQNRQLYTNTYFEMREINRRDYEANRIPRSSPEQLARMAREAAPKPLGPGEVNEVTGKVSWPPALQQDVFADERKRIESYLGSQSQMGYLSYGDQAQVRKLINDMAKELKSIIRMIPSADYESSKNFLKSLMYSTCRAQLG